MKKMIKVPKSRLEELNSILDSEEVTPDDIIKVTDSSSQFRIWTGVKWGSNPVPSSNLYLDQFENAAVAFSLRKLRTAYDGSCVKIRRSTDNALLDIGFVDDFLDMGAIETFVGAGNHAWVHTWFDQSGNGRHATNTSTITQPYLMYNGDWQYMGGHLGVRFDDTVASVADHLNFPVYHTASEEKICIITVAGIHDYGNYTYFVGTDNGDKGLELALYDAWGTLRVISARVDETAQGTGGTACALNTKYILGVKSERGESVWGYRNGEILIGVVETDSDFVLPPSYRLGNGSNGKVRGIIVMPELIAFNRFEFNEYASMTSTINDYYEVY